MLRSCMNCRLRHVKKLWMFCFLSLTFLAATLLVYQILFLEGSDYIRKYSDDYQKWNSVKDWPKVLRYKLTHAILNTSVSACPTLSIFSKPLSIVPASCRLPAVREEACSLAKSVFTTDPVNQSCNSSQSRVNLCRLEKTPEGSPKVECHTTSCGSSDIISVGFINSQDGSLSWGHFSFLQDVEKALNNYIQNTPKEEYFPFAFLRCDEFWNPKAKTQLFLLPPKTATADKTQTQLFLLPPKSAAADKTHSKFAVNPININIMLIDSVSRPHFYRSLPKTVNTFRSINKNSSTLVLDFELFHAIKYRTFESIYALFSGELFNTSGFVNPVPVKAGMMFDKFKSLGYQTMWQEDMCWTYEWGLVRDLKVMNKSLPLQEIWHNLASALKTNSIDFTGITHSSCEVLKSFDVPELFHGPSKMCYGGTHYHSLFLQFLQNFLQETDSDSGKKPLFSFSMLNVGHEDTGLRIQTFDESLAKFVKTSAAADSNTLTIILSDHGNTYGSFSNTPEGRFEIFQPHLFMIIPKQVQNLLGENKVQTLQHNQKRLVTITDVHHTLMAIAADIGNEGQRQNQGLFQPILSNRTCEDLQLLSSSLCICQGWEAKVDADSFHLIIAEFVLGQLNNMIQTQFLENSKVKSPVSGFGSCERLKAKRIANVREKRDGETLTVFLDIYVQDQGLFSATVQMITGGVLLNMELIEYERFSEYGIYQTCADKGVEIRLCICKQRTPKHKPVTTSYLSSVNAKPENMSSTRELVTPKWKHYGRVFDSETRADNMHESCLFVLSREYKSGVILEAANSCSFVSYIIELQLSLNNMQVSERTPLYTKLGPGEIHFLLAVIQLDPNINWSWKYTVNFKWKTIH